MVEGPGTSGGESVPSRPVRRGDVWVRREGSETAVFDPDTGQLHMLNASALAIWEACDGETTPDEIISALIELTELAVEQATAHVTKTVEDLRKAGLVT